MDAANLVELLTPEDVALINKIRRPKAFVNAARIAFGWTEHRVAAEVEYSPRNIDRWAADGGAHPAGLKALRDLIAAAETPLDVARFMAELRRHDDDPG